MSDQTIAATVGEITQGIEAFKKSQAERLDKLELKLARPGAFHAPQGEQTELRYLQTADGHKLPMLSAKQFLFDTVANRDGEGFSIGQYARDAIVGSTKAASGPALVPTSLSAIVLDDVRRKTAVIRAGAQTIIIDGPTVLAQITQDPTVYQHTEAAADITESDFLLAPLTVNPKTLAAIVPLSGELVSDSPNLDAVLQTSLSAAFALKLDALCLATLLADANIAKSLAAQDPAVWAKVLEAVGTALGLNQSLPSAIIGAPADLIARAGQLASTAGTWLGKPPILSGMAEIETTGVTAGTALFGDWSRAFAIAMRQELRLEVVRWAKAGSYSHLLIAHMRCDGMVLQPKHLYKMLKVV